MTVAFIKSFKGFDLGSQSFQVAGPLSRIPPPDSSSAPVLLNSPFSFLFASGFLFPLLLFFALLSSLLQRSRCRARISFPLHRSLGNWIVASNSAQDYGKEARSSIPLFLLLCLRLRRNFRIRSCHNFFSCTADLLLLRADRESSRNLFG